MKYEKASIDTLLNDERNVREHSEQNISAIRASLERFKQQKPIVVDGSGIVVAGNGTLVAAKQLGWKEIEVVRTKLKGEEAVAYAIADNRTAELAVWDDEALSLELLNLGVLDDETLRNAIGFTEEEIDRIIGGDEIDLGLDEATDDFAESDQFSTSRGVIFEIALPNDLADGIEIKEELIGLCDKRILVYKVRRS